MIDKIPAHHRVLLVRCKSWAMRGHLSDALAALDVAVAHDNLDSLTKAALLSAKAELLYLDGRNQDGLDIFRNALDAISEGLPAETRIAIGYNRSSLSLATLFAEGDADAHYALIDRSAFLGIEMEDTRSLLDATSQAERGKSYDSLPAIWREVLRTYYQGCWAALRAALRYMADECLRIGCFAEAAYNAMLVGQKELTKRVADALLRRESVDVIRDSVNRLIATGNLAKHFCQACSVIEMLHDAIPDALLHGVARWLLPRAVKPADDGIHRAAWTTLAALAGRLRGEAARLVVDAAITHPVWCRAPERGRISVSRKDMIRAVGGCSDGMDAHRLTEVARKTLPLLAEVKSDYDYPEALGLVCHLASIGGDSLKNELVESLYPRGRQLDTLLARAAHRLGKQVGTPEEIAVSANRIVESYASQVQHLNKDESPREVFGTMMTLTHEIDDKKVLVHVTNDVHLGFLTDQRHRLDEALVAKVIETMLSIVADEWNLLSNKSSLIWSIRDWGDCLSDDVAERVFSVLGPLASGSVYPPRGMEETGQYEHPLSRSRTNLGTTAEVQGAALYALACIERARPSIFGSRIQGLIESALLSRNSDVRKFAHWASGKLPNKSTDLVSTMILGTRDPIDEVARAAYDFFNDATPLKLTRWQWNLLIYSLASATQSSSRRIRASAAGVTQALLENLSSGVRLKKLKKIRSAFQRDFYDSVRSRTWPSR